MRVTRDEVGHIRKYEGLQGMKARFYYEAIQAGNSIGLNDSDRAVARYHLEAALDWLNALDEEMENE